MIHINRFVDKVSLVEGKKKDIILPLEEARGLRDEIVKLLTELHNAKANKKEDVIKVEVTGGKFK
jgi:hypothetical protein